MNIDFELALTAETMSARRLAEARATAMAQILEAIHGVTEAMTGPVPLAEKLSWSAKEAAARATMEGRATKAEAAMIEGEAAMTGESSVDLIGRILKNADAYRAAMAQLSGLRRAAEAAIDAAGDPATVEIAARTTLERLEKAAAELAG